MQTVQPQTTVDPGAINSLPPPGGGKAPAAGGSLLEQQAAFESMMAVLVASLNGGPLPPLTAQATGDTPGLPPGLMPQATGDADPGLDELQARLKVNLPSVGTGEGKTLTLATEGQPAPAKQTTALQATAPPSTDTPAPANGQPLAELMPDPPAMQAGVPQPPTNEADGSAVLAEQTAEQTVDKRPVGRTLPTKGTGLTGTTDPETNPLPNLPGLAPAEAPASAPAQASTSAPAPAAPASATQQVAQEVQLMLNRGENEATIRLHPDELGVVRVRLQFQNGQVHLSIQAEQQNTSQLLAGRLGELRLGLEGQGLRVGELALAADSTQTALGQASQREALSPLRTSGMDLSSDLNQQQSERQPSDFAGEAGDGQQHTPGRQGGRAARRYGPTGQMDASARLEMTPDVLAVGGYAQRFVAATGVDTYA